MAIPREKDSHPCLAIATELRLRDHFFGAGVVTFPFCLQVKWTESSVVHVIVPVPAALASAPLPLLTMNVPL